MVELMLDNTATSEFSPSVSAPNRAKFVWRVYVVGDGSTSPMPTITARRSDELEAMALPFQTLRRIAQDNPAPDEWLMGDEECPF